MANYNTSDNERHILDEIEENEQNERASIRREKKKNNIFDKWNKESEGVSKDEIPIANDPTLKNFFKLIGRKLNRLLSVNLLILAGNFPIFFIFLGLSGYLSIHTVQPLYAVFAPLKGAMMFDSSASCAALWSIFSRPAEVVVFTVWDYIAFGIGALVLFTYGPVRVGVTYILRNMFRGEPVFLMHDFFYAIKRNLRQAIIVGIMDLGIIFIFIKDIEYLNIHYSKGMMSVMFFMCLALSVVYILMRPYIYLMLVTFDISIFKMIKNAFLFTIIGIKRNIAVLLGTILVLALEYTLLAVYIPLGVIIPFIILPSFLIMMGIYGAYPKIKEIMIDPYYTPSSEEDETE